VALKSWVDSANYASDFPLENLPLGVFRAGRRAHIGVAIGDRILDLANCFDEGLIQEEACSRESLNALMSRGREASRALRARLTEMLTEGAADRQRTAKNLIPRKGAEMLLPCTIGDYTDFYASLQHATNVGSMFRPDNPLLPNYKYVPIGYHGRASSIVVSGTPFRRPKGQLRDDANEQPVYAASRRLDYEMEIGALIGRGNALGEPIAAASADEHLFGLCLINDWSARDIQTWEYQPLGPFLAKNFATSISPWVVTMEALEPFRVPAAERPAGDPEPLPYLQPAGDAFDITVEVSLKVPVLEKPMRLSRGNFRELYWTLAQLVAHHSSNGCNLQPGDLLGSGTISGATKESRGSMLELTWRGSEPLQLPNGETRRFLEDGDEVIMRAWCEKDGVRIGFGECRGTIAPAD
jgi:fumarylacetoacetase